MNGRGRQAPHRQWRNAPARRLAVRHRPSPAAAAAPSSASSSRCNNYSTQILPLPSSGRVRAPCGNAVAQDAARLCGGFGRGARGAETRDQAGQRNRVSGSERYDASLQRVPSELFAHRSSSVPEDAVTTNTLTTNKFPRQRKNSRLLRCNRCAQAEPGYWHWRIDPVQHAALTANSSSKGTGHANRSALSSMLLLTALVTNCRAGACASRSCQPAGRRHRATAPHEVALTFTQNLEAAFSTVEVTDASGARVDEGKAQISGNTMRIGLKALGRAATRCAGTRSRSTRIRRKAASPSTSAAPKLARSAHLCARHPFRRDDHGGGRGIFSGLALPSRHFAAQAMRRPLPAVMRSRLTWIVWISLAVAVISGAAWLFSPRPR